MTWKASSLIASTIPAVVTEQVAGRRALRSRHVLQAARGVDSKLAVDRKRPLRAGSRSLTRLASRRPQYGQFGGSGSMTGGWGMLFGNRVEWAAHRRAARHAL